MTLGTKTVRTEDVGEGRGSGNEDLNKRGKMKVTKMKLQCKTELKTGFRKIHISDCGNCVLCSFTRTSTCSCIRRWSSQVKPQSCRVPLSGRLLTNCVETVKSNNNLRFAVLRSLFSINVNAILIFYCTAIQSHLAEVNITLQWLYNTSHNSIISAIFSNQERDKWLDYTYTINVFTTHKPFVQFLQYLFTRT